MNSVMNAEKTRSPTITSPAMTRRTRAAPTPVLRFNPSAWAKLLFLRDLGQTEVGGFGIAAADDPLLVEDFVLVPQTCTWASVKFHDAGVADFFDMQVDAGRTCDSFARIWCHTHPGNCPQPSGVDEDTFARVFGSANWAIMFIIAQGGETYARLRFNVGPGGEIQIPVSVDFSEPFTGTDFDAWTDEYDDNVIEEVIIPANKPGTPLQKPVTTIGAQLTAEDEWAIELAEEQELYRMWHDVWPEYIDESAAVLEVL